MNQVYVSPFPVKYPSRQNSCQRTKNRTSQHIQGIVNTNIHLCICYHESPGISQVHPFFKNTPEGEEGKSGDAEMVGRMIGNKAKTTRTFFKQ